MEKAEFLMLMKRKNIMNYSHFQESSWEEKAFAEDAAGGLGGCIWPPRSYSCSFCHREFRSAQALGGHMNVHRRDRARLKLDQDHDSVHLSDSKPRVEEEEDDSATCLDLSVGLNLVIFKNGSYGDEAIISCKRPKIGASSMKFFIEPLSGSMEGELDLELRLGVSPKVK